jgi:hypothetical protein
MSGYDDPKPEHRNALKEINEARQMALTAVSEMRKTQISTPHRNLAPTTSEGETPTLSVIATQAVVDYLLQLRPYRKTSKKWNVDFGTVALPKKLDGGSAPGRDRGKNPHLWICQQPEVPLNNVSQLIESLNQTVHYSTNRPTEAEPDFHPKPTKSETIRYRIRAESYPGEHWVDEDTFKAIRKGAMTVDEAVEMGAILDENTDEDGDDEYVPATPAVRNEPGDTPGKDGKIKSFKFVLGPQYLLQVVELADEVAAEMDLLIELDDPREQDTGGI